MGQHRDLKPGPPVCESGVVTLRGPPPGIYIYCLIISKNNRIPFVQYALPPLQLFPENYDVDIAGTWENDGHGGEFSMCLVCRKQSQFIGDDTINAFLLFLLSQVHPRCGRASAGDVRRRALPGRAARPRRDRLRGGDIQVSLIVRERLLIIIGQ